MTDLELARECGNVIGEDGPDDRFEVNFTAADIATFAARIRQEEREAAAAICEKMIEQAREEKFAERSREARGQDNELSALKAWQAVRMFNASIKIAAAAIRNRGESQ